MANIATNSLNDILPLTDFDQMDSMNLDDYIDKYGIVVGSFAQALDFGSPLPEMVVTNLIVDDGDFDRGNRKNMFRSKYKIVGIAHGMHNEFKSTTVIIYCQNFYSKGEDKFVEMKPGKETKKIKCLKYSQERVNEKRP